MPLASATDQIVAGMALEEKVGQVMMVGLDGYGPGPEVTKASQDLHGGSLTRCRRNSGGNEKGAGIGREERGGREGRTGGATSRPLGDGVGRGSPDPPWRGKRRLRLSNRALQRRN